MNLFLEADLGKKRALLASLGVAACLVEQDADGFEVVAMNDHCRRYYGLSPEIDTVRIDAKSLGRASGMDEGLLEPIVQRMRDNYARCIEAGTPIHTENEVPTPDGSFRWSRNTISPIFRDDTLVCLLVVIVDITEMIDAQRELEANLVRLIGHYVQVCPGCKRVKGDEGAWLALEEYMIGRGDLQFSHGICPSCSEEVE